MNVAASTEAEETEMGGGESRRERQNAGKGEQAFGGKSEPQTLGVPLRALR